MILLAPAWKLLRDFSCKSTIILIGLIPILSGCNASKVEYNLNVTTGFRGIGNVDTKLDVYRKPLLEKCWEISISPDDLNIIKAEGGTIVRTKDWKEIVKFIPKHKEKWAKRTYSELSSYRDIYSKAECIGNIHTIKLPEKLVNRYIKNSNKQAK